MSRRSPLVLSLLTLTTLALVAACSSSAGSLKTADAWARPGSSGAETAAYLTITNSGSAADSLLSASSPSAASVELHETSMDTSGMTGMHPIDKVEIPAGGSVTLEPGGKHLMVMGLTKDLAVGDALEVDLVFQNAGTVKVQAEVKQP
jgi:periplasmic copper chaperone A